MLADELLGEVTLHDGIGQGTAGLALQRLGEARIVVADVGEDFWAGLLRPSVFHRLGAGSAHQVPFALGAGTVFPAVGFVDNFTQGRAEPRPEDKDGDIDAAFGVQDHLDALLEGHIGHERQVFPEDRLEQQAAGIAAAQPGDHLLGFAAFLGNVARRGDEDANGSWFHARSSQACRS